MKKRILTNEPGSGYEHVRSQLLMRYFHKSNRWDEALIDNHLLIKLDFGTMEYITHPYIDSLRKPKTLSWRWFADLFK